MKASKPFNLLLLILILFNAIALAQPGSYYPAPSSVNYQADTLTIHPPDSLPADPVILMGYNIYVDDDFYDNVMVTDLEEPVHFYLDDESLLPGSRIFCVDAVYSEWISESTCDTATILYGNELPFLEDWSSGSFESLQWKTDSDHWVINSGEGNPDPSATFQGEPGLTNYEVILESYPINTVGLVVGRIWLDFDLNLASAHSTGNEKLIVQAWNHTEQVWHSVAEFSNAEGSMDWELEHTTFSYTFKNKVIKIRFLATGENSADILSWSIDNIHIYRNCEKPVELEIEEEWEYNKLTWIGFYGSLNLWIHWDDGDNAGNSIGTGSAVEFDVAARWAAGHWTPYNGCLLDKIAFFPAESQAIYNVRIWTGSGPDTLIIDQPVESPEIGEWNFVTLNDPLVFDASKELWIGYHVSAQTGYPAGVDDGPAHNGFGNMMYYDSAWQTLLEINPDLNYNWNIAGRFYVAPDPPETFYIYRGINLQDFELYDITTTNEWEYVDSNIVLSDIYCYKVTELWSYGSDTCESDPSNTACEVVFLGTDQSENESNIQIFPNPAHDFLNIESPEKINEVRIYNTLGECELKLEIGNWEERVDVSRLQCGIYFVEVVTASGTYKSKVLIIR